MKSFIDVFNIESKKEQIVIITLQIYRKAIFTVFVIKISLELALTEDRKSKALFLRLHKNVIFLYVCY